MQVISQLMERSEEATQQARELASEAEQLQVRLRCKPGMSAGSNPTSSFRSVRSCAASVVQSSMTR